METDQLQRHGRVQGELQLWVTLGVGPKVGECASTRIKMKSKSGCWYQIVGTDQCAAGQLVAGLGAAAGRAAPAAAPSSDLGHGPARRPARPPPARDRHGHRTRSTFI